MIATIFQLFSNDHVETRYHLPCISQFLLHHLFQLGVKGFFNFKNEGNHYFQSAFPSKLRIIIRNQSLPWVVISADSVTSFTPLFMIHPAICSCNLRKDGIPTSPHLPSSAVLPGLWPDLQSQISNDKKLRPYRYKNTKGLVWF